MSAAPKKQQTPQAQPTPQVTPQIPSVTAQAQPAAQARPVATAPAAQQPTTAQPQAYQHAAAPQHPSQVTAAQQAQYNSYYYYYQNHPAYAAQWAAQAATQARPAAAQTTTTTTTQTTQQAAAPTLDTADVATLNDALGSAGVDLRAEEESLRQSAMSGQAASQSRGTQRRARKQGKKVVFDSTHLGAKMRTIAAGHGLQTETGTNGVPEDSVSYLGLALRARLSKLVEGMVAAAAHREETDHTRTPGLYEDGSPMWSVAVRKDIGKQLTVLEKVEREEELQARRDRKAREAYTSGQPSLPSLDDALQMEQEDEPKKKKKKPDGPGVTAKNMSEDVRKKFSNATATAAAGLNTSKYAWMNAGTAASGPPVKKAAGTVTASTTTTSTWAKYQPPKKKDEPVVEEDSRRPITMKDAVFVVERERGHGGGRGAARGWT
ncbi:hypothetical protein M422DRAFT_238832 [Sphaerobolus stellatus SS14]|nr:hypothetical protein M422DRAFT_238832 [Sphaerobolus stellatus SS14]